MPVTFDRAALDRLATSMNRYVDDGSTSGLVLLLNIGEDTWLHHHGVQDLATGVPMAPDSIFRIASMAKAVLGVATLQLVEEGRLDLDAPVDAWLPELANRQVVRSMTGPLDDTTPADRPITTRHLLELTWGLGALMAEEGESPLQDAIYARGVGPGPFQPELSPDDFMAALGTLPLAHQPGQGWLYHTGYDVLPILIARVAGQSTEEFLQERIFIPLGMDDTSFSVPESSLGRLTTAYTTGQSGLDILDPAVDSRWLRPPGVPNGLVSTAPDFMRFGRMLLAQGESPAGRSISPASVREMVSDHIPARTKAAFPFYPGFWDNTGWGYGVSVRTGPSAGSDLGEGSYGWAGGINTHWKNDPTTDLVAVFLTNRQVGSPADEGMIAEFWRLTREVVDG